MQEPIRVAQIMGKWHGGGVESVVMNYYRNINRKKIQFDFICDDDSTNIPYDEIKSLGGRVILVPPYQNVIKYHQKLKKILRKNGYRIVHSHLSTLSVFPLLAAKRSGVPIRIAHSHSTTNKKEFKKNLMKQVLRPFSKVYATHYFCCSEHAGRWQFDNKEYNKGNVYLLNNAIDIDKFAYNYKIREQKRKELNISNNTLVIGHIGRFVTVKNHEFLIEVFNEIQKLHNNTLLLLAGTGPLEEKIKSKVKTLGLEEKVIFLGQRNDTNELYQAMDVFVLPSLYEGLPVVGIEAQASGLPMILSENVTPEVKILNTTKMLSLKKTAKYWANEILSVCQNLVREDKTKELNKCGFNIKIENKCLYKIYEKLLKKGSDKL